MSIVTEIYNLSKSRVPQGWMVEEKCDWFFKCYSHMQPKVAVEFGVFYGLSAIAQGLIIKHLSLNCKLYAVDAWDKEASLEGSNSPENNEWWGSLNYSDAHVSFLSHVEHFGLQDIIIPVKGKSCDVAGILPDRIDLLHADGNHSYEVVSQEIELYAPKISDFGIWIADDVRWKEMGGATDKLANYGFGILHEYNENGQSFNVYQKN